MITFIGEILVDMFGESKGGELTYKACPGGATFNAGVNAKQVGAEVAFIGRVGNDSTGRFLTSQAQKVGFDYLDIQVDSDRNTTLAFVTLVDGERDCTFNRHDTADYNIDINKIDFERLKNTDIIYVGSIMLSEKEGRKFAEKLTKIAKKKGVKLAFDVNFRMDLYGDFNQAVKAYAPLIKNSDIVKFSQDELALYTGIEEPIKAIESIYSKDKLVVVTMGSKGSLYYFNGDYGIIPTKEIKPIDTTGAGDAFFGALLAEISGKELTKEVIQKSLEKANDKGAMATQFVGAVKI